MAGLRNIVLIALLSGGLLSCKPATEEDRKALVGVWIPDDGSGHAIEFRQDGVFNFLYETAPPGTVLQIKWSLDTKGEVEIRAADGSRYKTCRYSIDGRKLAIDDGNGAECLRPAVTPVVLMPKAFTKADAP
jgi:hypothetical protein